MFKFNIGIRHHLLVLSSIWVVMQAVILMQFGVVTNLEATKYIQQAHHLLEMGSYSSLRFLFYSTQILLIAACIKLGISFVPIVVLQMFFSGLSALYFYKTANRFANARIAFFSTAYLLIFFYYHLYNTYLFTESLFFSFSILYTYFLFTRERINFSTVLSLLLFLLLLYVTRPTGIFFIPATALFIITKFYPRNIILFFASAGILLPLFYLLVNFSIGSGGEFDFMLPYDQEMVICGVTTITQSHSLEVPVTRSSIESLLYIITHYPGLFVKLALNRAITFLGVYRSYYSPAHNIIGMIYFFIIYFIIITSFLFKKPSGEHKVAIWFILCYILLVAITVMLSCDEWHNRFLLSLLPFLIILATIGLGEKYAPVLPHKIPRIFS